MVINLDAAAEVLAVATIAVAAVGLFFVMLEYRQKQKPKFAGLATG